MHTLFPTLLALLLLGGMSLVLDLAPREIETLGGIGLALIILVFVAMVQWRMSFRLCHDNAAVNTLMLCWLAGGLGLFLATGWSMLVGAAGPNTVLLFLGAATGGMIPPFRIARRLSERYGF